MLTEVLFFPKRVVYSRSPHDGSEVVSQVHGSIQIEISSKRRNLFLMFINEYGTN